MGWLTLAFWAGLLLFVTALIYACAADDADAKAEQKQAQARILAEALKVAADAWQDWGGSEVEV